MRTAPDSVEECVVLTRAARDKGHKLAIQGNSTWLVVRGDVTVTTTNLNSLVELDAQDLVVTAQAGVAWNDLQAVLAKADVWVAIDVPGVNRTVGSIVATGTAGPLRFGFGEIRDHVLGISFISGSGDLITSGSRVMKNVAGFDLKRLNIGGYGAFGIITEVHLRLRRRPHADQTVVIEGNLITLLERMRDLLNAPLSPSAFELIAPPDSQPSEWTLALRFLGSTTHVEAMLKTTKMDVGTDVRVLTSDESDLLWSRLSSVATEHPVVIKIGATQKTIQKVAQLTREQLGSGEYSYSPFAGLRWCGACEPDQIKRLRSDLLPLGVPVTIERCPPNTLSAIGIFGKLRPGVDKLLAGLRTQLDPHDILAVGGVLS